MLEARINQESSRGLSKIENIASSTDAEKPKQKEYIDPFDSEYKIHANNKAGKQIHTTTKEDENAFIKKLNDIYKDATDKKVNL